MTINPNGLTLGEAYAWARKRWADVPLDKLDNGHADYEIAMSILADEIDRLRGSGYVQSAMTVDKPGTYAWPAPRPAKP